MSFLSVLSVNGVSAREQVVSPLPIPPLAGFRLDPDTGLKVWRLGGSATEMQQQHPHPEGAAVITLLHAQHFYSRTSPANRDETHALSSGGQHQPDAALWRLKDKQLVAWIPAADPAAHLQQRQLLWDKQAANVYWFTSGNRLMRASIDFDTYQTRTEVWDTFPAFDYVTFGFGEGNFSDDGKRVVLAGEATGGAGIYLQPYEVSRKQALPWRKVADEEGAVDWASVDPSGEYVVYAQHAPQEITAVVPFSEAASAKPRDLLDDVKHGDMILDDVGQAWWVYGNWRGLFAVRLANGDSKRIWPVQDTGDAEDAPPSYNASGHVARIAGKPGWVLLSRQQNGALHLVDSSGKHPARYVGNSRHGSGEVTNYKREARAASSFSGHYLFFVSDYNAHAKRGYDPEPEPGTAYLNLIERDQEP
ncbi:MAG: hypothetical protein BWK73_11575 [Thiothrix lacustris]|uniref:Uncharacterized protein n=1 Tax=Thiothrix lacustris TaxID=525917 RepID=A0A1Y1QTY5_9GAMM|nr:MAG: hypothetical protein BWK73_11575 [Thiothrix lacustris]